MNSAQPPLYDKIQYNINIPHTSISRGPGRNKVNRDHQQTQHQPKHNSHVEVTLMQVSPMHSLHLVFFWFKPQSYMLDIHRAINLQKSARVDSSTENEFKD